MAISKKRIIVQLRMILDTKKRIDQPGRLLDHLQNELKLTGKSGNGGVKALLAEAIEELVDKGLATVTKRGHVYDAIERTERKRARPTPQAAQPATAPTQKKESAINAASVATATQHDEPAIEFAQAEATSEPHLDPVEMMELMATSAEELEARLTAEQLAHAETSRQKASIAAAKQRLEREMGQLNTEMSALRQQLELEQAENERLREEAAAANEQLRAGVAVLEQAQTALREAQAANGQLEAQLQACQQASDNSLDALAQRVARIIKQ